MRDPRTYAIIGAAMAVHQELGPGFLEGAYHEAMMIELAAQDVPFLHEVELPIFYKGRPLKTIYRADFVCYEDIIVEIKAIKAIGRVEEAQILHYLKASGLKTGLLLNFGALSLEYKRFI